MPDFVIQQVSRTFEIANASRTYAVQATGNPGPAGADAESWAGFEATNKAGATLAAGMPVCVHSSGVGVVAADATNDTTPAYGLLTAETASLAAGSVQVKGPLTLNDWTAITGTAALTARGRYYLQVGGGLTTTPPAVAGQIVQLVGLAVSDYTLSIEVAEPITL